ncbi:unnamed protein product [Rhizophagus irregularis]|nr:unnamed protein product [Rhizophagus irregularis]
MNPKTEISPLYHLIWTESLRLIYASKPEDSASQETKDAWLKLEQTTLNSRALVLDALLFGNEIRKEQALRSISPGYRKQSEREEVFGEELPEIICKENETNKLFNDAAWQKRHANQFRSPRTQASNNFRNTSTNSSSYKGSTRIPLINITNTNKAITSRETSQTAALKTARVQLNNLYGYGGWRSWFASRLMVRNVREIRYGSTDLNIFSHEISELLKIKAIQEMDPEEPCFVSNLFMVPKKGGSLRPVIDLRKLNIYVKYSHFKMEGIDLAKSLARCEDFMVSIDLNQAFYHVPVSTGLRKFFTFDFMGK